MRHPIIKISLLAIFLLTLCVGQTITTQGVLRDGTGHSVADDTYSMTFRIYDALEGGTLEWESAQDIEVTNGIYNVILGSDSEPLNMLAGDGSYWLGVEIGSDGEMTPRLKLSISPYEFARIAGLQNVFPDVGNVGIGTSGPDYKLDVEGNIGLSGSHLIYNSTHGVIDWGSQSSGNLYFRTLNTKGDNTDFNDMAVITNDGKVGIGTTSPSGQFHVVGPAGGTSGTFQTPTGTNTVTLLTSTGGANWGSTLRFVDNGTVNAQISSIADGQLRIYTDGNMNMAIAKNGYVGIGTSTPSQKLEVNKTNSNTRIRINRSTNVYESFLEWSTGNAGKFLLGLDNNNDKFRLYSYEGAGTILEIDGTNGTTYLDGKLGIGTTSPTGILDVRGKIRNDEGASYDIWLQGGSATSGVSRNLALIGFKSTDKLYLNYGGEYEGGTIIGGNVGIGTASPAEKLHVSGDAYVTSKLFVGGNLYQRVDGTTQGWHKIDDDDGNDDAQWYETNDSPSDIRLKTNVNAILDPINKLKQLRGVTYNWNAEAKRKFTAFTDDIIAGPGADDNTDIAVRDEIKKKELAKYSQVEMGVIAQEVKAVIPEVVHEKEDGYLQVAYGNLVGLLIEAVKEQQQMIDDQKTEYDQKISDLEQRIKEIESNKTAAK